ncbi:amino acid transporter AVT1H-like [Ischnura elegans]|uniref:amino acid transporter AVT1H-like n=1 Tax=Ischnura elegans TaxID=197161 RepID=UPI001ED899E9|nr:amino acid transporter AVT1H-like [Ischnura elegans]
MVEGGDTTPPRLIWRSSGFRIPSMRGEERPLLKDATSDFGYDRPPPQEGLSLFFAILLMIDLFGVFPIMALPGTIIRCGWLGIPLAVTVFSLQIYTATLLGRCWVMAEVLQPSIVEKSRFPYAALAEEALGSWARGIVTFIVDLTVFGGGIPNLLIAAQNLQLFGAKMSCFEFNVSFCIWLVFVGILMCPLMWLGSPKDMKWLAVTSSGTVLTVTMLTWSSMLTDQNVPVPPVTPTPTWESVAMAYGILAFQFDIHPNILTVQMDMQHKHKMGKAVLLSFCVTGGLSMITTIIALHQYGDLARPNLLQGLPGSYMLYFNVLLVTLQICLSMVVGGSALFQDIEDTLGVPREFNWKRCAIRSTILMTAVFLAETVPRFDLVMGLIGAALTGPLMFLLPPLFYIRLSRKLKLREESLGLTDGGSMYSCMKYGYDEMLYPRLHTGHVDHIAIRQRRASNTVFEEEVCGIPWEILLAFFVIFIGIGATATAIYFGVEESIRYAQFSPSCLQNSTAASDLALFLDEGVK